MNNRQKNARKAARINKTKLPRLLHRPQPQPRQLLDQGTATMAESPYFDADYGAEDKEVKINLRFCDK